MTSPVDDVQPSEKRFRALALSGGGFDTVMQLGVAHALLVNRGVAPDCVIGISAGAVNATAIAEILQAGYGETDAGKRMALKANRLRQFINAFVEVPAQLADAIIPDSLEVVAKSPLKPLESPLHYSEERSTREKANQAKAGLITLVNDFFEIRLPFSTAAVFIRRILGWMEAPEQPAWGRRFWRKVRNEAGIFAILWYRALQIAPIVARLTWAAIRAERTQVHRKKTANRQTAGDIISKWKRIRKSFNWLKYLFEIAVYLPMLSALTAVWALVLLPISVVTTRKQSSMPSNLSFGLGAIWDRILAYYGLRDGLANSDVIKQHLIQCLDPDYYGVADLGSALTRALKRDKSMNDTVRTKRKRLGVYQMREPKIHVAPVAANIADGKLEVIPSQVPVVDALLAATAYVPFLPAVKIDPDEEAKQAELAAAAEQAELTKEGKTAQRIPIARDRRTGWFIDGINVSNQPTSALMDYLRDVDLSGYRSVDVYPVSALPISAGEWPETVESRGVVDVAMRAMGLRKLRDATLEMTLTQQYTRAIVDREAVVQVEDGTRFVNANVFPLELCSPPQINRTALLGTPAETREAIYRTIADGCRASLHGMIADDMYAAAAAVEDAVHSAETRHATERPAIDTDVHSGTVPPTRVIADEAASFALNARAGIAPICVIALAKRFGKRGIHLKSTEAQHTDSDDRGEYPGLSEVCRNCQLFVPERREQPDLKASDPRVLELATQTKQQLGQLVKHRGRRRNAPIWPVDPDLAPRNVAPSPAIEPERGEEPEVPQTTLNSLGRPVVSMLFGGGVFRGVFHMGVMNGLNELGLDPHVVAGSSVGSIVAAMIGQVFTHPPAERKKPILQLAATFLTIDQFILTDRLADFVRKLTLRARRAEFSPYDLDRVFRRFDEDGAARFSRRLRRVVAGMERLFYISPFELRQLAEMYRENQLDAFKKEILRDVQEFFDRSDIGQEILGSEPLRTLIEHHVIIPLGAKPGEDRTRLLLNLFEKPLHGGRGLHFFATTTNLKRGKLEMLKSATGREPVSLLFALLASSAFPAIFRPRQSWELRRLPAAIEPYIDGGVIDNLPLDCIADFLDKALRGPMRRPSVKVGDETKRVPHLVFTASLEVDKEVFPTDQWDVEEIRRSCRRLSSRAATFAYNRKIDAYARVQRDLRRIHEHFAGKDPMAYGDRAPLDLHVIAVKPKWLCGTFGFHPMLGFRRAKQAASIAHGCASTLGTLYAEWKGAGRESRAKEWIPHWGRLDANDALDSLSKAMKDIDPKAVTVSRCAEAGGKLSREPAHVEVSCELNPQKRIGRADKENEGLCWFRQTAVCPFSRKGVGEVFPDRTNKEDAAMQELTEIYRACGRTATHRGARR